MVGLQQKLRESNYGQEPVFTAADLRAASVAGVAAFIEGCKAAESRASLRAPERLALLREGAAIALVEGISLHWADADAQCAALACMRSLATMSVGADNSAELVEAGAIEAAVGALGAHPHRADVQEQAFRTLLRLVLDGTNSLRITLAGGIEQVVAGMGRHQENPRVQEHGCWLLRNLAAEPKNQSAIARADGVRCVVAALVAHRATVSVLKAGCQATWSLAVHNDNGGAIGAIGGIQALVDAMGAPPLSLPTRATQTYPPTKHTPSHILQSCFFTLCFAPDNFECPTLPTAGSFHLLNSLACLPAKHARSFLPLPLPFPPPPSAAAHPNNARLQESACGALWNVCCHPQNPVRTWGLPGGYPEGTPAHNKRAQPCTTAHGCACAYPSCLAFLFAPLRGSEKPPAQPIQSVQKQAQNSAQKCTL